MARVTDPQKIENVKRAAMEIIVEYGYRGASIAAIAKKANVSAGYLYRYYVSKEELIEDLMNSNLYEVKKEITDHVKNSKTIYEFLHNLMQMMFKLAKEDAINVLMTSTLILDSDFEKNMSKKDQALKDEVIQTIIELGKKTGEINEAINQEDITLTVLTIPFRYITLKIKEEDNERYFRNDQIERIVRLCLNALK